MSEALLPLGGTSVMANRAPVEEDDLYGRLNYFPTPPWAARAVGELIRRIDPAARTCWEPACGEGHMAHGLADYFDTVGCSDIHPFGGHATFDFLAPTDPPTIGAVAPHWDWIVTNPPFSDGEAFVRAAYRRARRGVAMLLRSAFREGAGRSALFCDLSYAGKAQFAERVPMVKGRYDPDASSATAYAVFIWIKPVVASPVADLARQIRATVGPGHGLDLLIHPDAKKRLLRASDLVRFAGAPDQGDLLGGRT